MEWRIEGDSMRIVADIPAGTAARIVFPDGTVHAVGSGHLDLTAALAVSTLAVSTR